MKLGAGMFDVLSECGLGLLHRVVGKCIHSMLLTPLVDAYVECFKFVCCPGCPIVLSLEAILTCQWLFPGLVLPVRPFSVIKLKILHSSRQD